MTDGSGPDAVGQTDAEQTTDRLATAGAIAAGSSGTTRSWNPDVCHAGERPAGRPGNGAAPSTGRDASGPPEEGVDRRGFLAAGGAVATAIAGCASLGGDGDGSDDGATPAIRAVLEENVRTLETEDLDAHMGTIHPESPVYARTEQTMAQFFEAYDVSVELSIESVSVDGDSAEAEVEQTTRETSGASDYRDNRVRVTHELRTYEGEWRIYATTLLDREFL